MGCLLEFLVDLKASRIYEYLGPVGRSRKPYRAGGLQIGLQIGFEIMLAGHGVALATLS